MMGRFMLVACTNVGRHIIETLMKFPSSELELVGVVNLNAEQGMKKANYDSYRDLALRYGFPIHYCNHINDESTVSFIKQMAPDIILQSGWSQKFSDVVLQLPTYGCIGEHPAPLPKGRGAACVNWAILSGETEWGDSYFQMVSEYDKGNLYAQKFFQIEAYDTVYTVYEKVAQCAVEVVREYAEKWTRGEFNIVKQDESQVTYYKRRCPADGEIRDFNQSADVLHNFIRAQTHPYPGAFLATRKGKLYLLQSRVCKQKNDSASPGTVYDVSENGGVLVSAGNGSVLEILRVKPEQGPSAWAKDWEDFQQLPCNLFEI